jgi:hypothetical protein
MENKLTPKGPRMHDFKTTNSIDRIVKNIIEMGPNFISPELVKNITCIGQNRKKLEQKELHIRPTQNYREKDEAQFGLLGPLGVNH